MVWFVLEVFCQSGWAPTWKRPIIEATLDSFTVLLHSPNGRRLPAISFMQGDSHWCLKTSGNSHWSLEPIMQGGTSQSQFVFRPANHKCTMPTNWRPCLMPHCQSYCHQARTVWPSKTTWYQYSFTVDIVLEASILQWFAFWPSENKWMC